MVNITIDGKKIEVAEGTTVLRAAQSAGIQIPTLCDHPELTPYGGCRLCLVEVEGARTLQPSCTLPAGNNMVVKTDTEKTRDARKFVLTMIFSERNHFCPFCQVSGGDCELQNSAYHEGMTHWPMQPNWQTFAVDASNPHFILDNNRCILCRRCVRACGELVGNFTLGFEERGYSSFLVADLGTPLGESSCISCGTCLQVCPTGALIDRQSAYRGREVQVDHHETVCVGCSLGCGLDVMTRDNNLMRIEGNWKSEISKGLTCKVGRFYPVSEEHERLTTPLIKKDGKLKAATWDEAMSYVGTQLKPLAGKNSEGIAAIASTRLTAEALHLFKELFAGGLKSDLVTSTEEGSLTCASSAFAAEVKKPFEGSLSLLKESDCVLVLGEDPAAFHEVASFYIKRNLPAGTKLFVADSEANTLSSNADINFVFKKGKESDIINALAAAKSGDAAKVSGYAKDSGVREEDIITIAKAISSASKPVIVYGKEISSNLTLLKALFDLAKTLGVLKEGHAGLISLKGNANSFAAAQLGLDQAFKTNGHKAVFVALGDDAPTQRLIQSLNKKPFLVVQASYVSPLTAMADVVLPVKAWTEEEGHYINSDGKVQKAIKSLDGHEDVRSNEAVLLAVAKQVGVKVNVDGWKDAVHKKTPAVTMQEI